jgi:lipopolysaccharide transport system permease protein
MIISLTKYRDFSYLIGFGVQLLMYVSAVVYPMALVAAKNARVRLVGQVQPLAYIIESTRYML